jgi:hypothetical protein
MPPPTIPPTPIATADQNPILPSLLGIVKRLSLLVKDTLSAKPAQEKSLA